MKKIALLPLLALVIAVAASAFTHQPNRSTMSEAWFLYNGIGNPADQDSYTYSSTDPGCSDEEVLCAVRAEIDPATFDPQHPNNSKPLETGSGVNSLQTLNSESNGFTMATADVQLQE